jgi:hypothetical protein
MAIRYENGRTLTALLAATIPMRPFTVGIQYFRHNLPRLRLSYSAFILSSLVLSSLVPRA